MNPDDVPDLLGRLKDSFTRPAPATPPEGERPTGRCVGCFHDFEAGPCGGCGAVLAPGCTGDGEWFNLETYCHDNDDCPGHAPADLKQVLSR